MNDYVLNVIGKLSVDAVCKMINYLDEMCNSDFRNLTQIVMCGVEAKIYHDNKEILIKEAE